MGIQYQYQVILKDAAGKELLDKTVSLEAGASPLIDEVIPQNSDNLTIELPLDASALKGLVIHVDNDATIATNDDDDGTPAHTFELEADKPLFWHEDSGLANPLGSTDVDDIRISTGAVGDTRLRIWPLQDPTP